MTEVVEAQFYSASRYGKICTATLYCGICLVCEFCTRKAVRL